MAFADPPVAELDAPDASRSRRRGPWIAGVILVGAVVLAVAIATRHGSDSDRRSALQVLNAATARTTASPYHDETTQVLRQGGRVEYTVKTAGDQDPRADNGTDTITFSGAGTVLVDRLVRGTEYQSFGGETLPHGAHWVKVLPSERHVVTTPTLGSTDPGSGLEFLSADKRNPRAAGHATIDGTRTTRYEFDLDLAAATLQSARRQHDKLSASDLREIAGLHHVPAQAWIDGSDHVRRFEIDISEVDGGSRYSARFDIDFSRFGEQVDVHAPAASDTISATEYARYRKTHPDS